MTSRKELRKVAGRCVGCGTVYAAEEWPDGSVRSIGRRDGCRCGETELRVVEDGQSERGGPKTVG